MSIDYVEDLQESIIRGARKFACPGPRAGEWYLGDSIDELRPKAKRTAASNRMPTSIFRLVDKMDATTGDSFLVIKKFLEPGPRGEPNLQWSQVDTREAADMLRDVSQGPSPYFGLVVEETVAAE